jgi:hypothetical protein
MAREPQDATLQILRQIQSKLTDHDRHFEQLDERFERLQEQIDRRFRSMQEQLDGRFDAVDRRLDELLDATITALGTASVANVRHERANRHDAEVELELRKRRARLKQLEEKV